MIIRSLELKDFRNYQELQLRPDPGINIFYGDNAQGKTNILEAIYVGCTGKSHRAIRDNETIRFGESESHIRMELLKKELSYRIDMHIKKNRSKGIALNGVPLRKISELYGTANVIFFSPEDLSLIKNGPAERRRFMDMELCQISSIYTHELISYNKVAAEKNRLLKEAEFGADIRDFISIYNEQLVKFGIGIIERRKKFIQSINEIIREIHLNITGGKEEITILYEPDVSAEALEEALRKNLEREIKYRMCLVGPQRDDLGFKINEVDIRHYGSQGQQRTAALSLKMAEIRFVESVIQDRPVLLLDDVLSELDRSRQTMLLDSIENIQTMISCTGIDDFIGNRFRIDKIFKVQEGKVIGEN